MNGKGTAVTADIAVIGKANLTADFTLICAGQKEEESGAVERRRKPNLLTM